MSEAVKFGPCGAAKRPDAVENARDVHIFKPVLPSSGDVCGYKYVIPPPTAVEQPIRVSIPEEFISTKQAEYPKVDPTCPYTVCKGTTPATAVTVVLTTSAGVRMGRVVSNPPGITVSAAGKTSAMFSGDVTLTAEPTNKHARAVFSGDCSKTGGYGERAECIVKLAPDPNITVDFECEQGFTCGAGGKR